MSVSGRPTVTSCILKYYVHILFLCMIINSVLAILFTSKMLILRIGKLKYLSHPFLHVQTTLAHFLREIQLWF